MPKYLPPPHKFRPKTLDSTDTVDFTHFRRTVNRYCELIELTFQLTQLIELILNLANSSNLQYNLANSSNLQYNLPNLSNSSST